MKRKAINVLTTLFSTQTKVPNPIKRVSSITYRRTIITFGLVLLVIPEIIFFQHNGSSGVTPLSRTQRRNKNYQTKIHCEKLTHDISEVSHIVDSEYTQVVSLLTIEKKFYSLYNIDGEDGICQIIATFLGSIVHSVSTHIELTEHASIINLEL